MDTSVYQCSGVCRVDIENFQFTIQRISIVDIVGYPVNCKVLYNLCARIMAGIIISFNGGAFILWGKKLIGTNTNTNS